MYESINVAFYRRLFEYSITHYQAFSPRKGEKKLWIFPCNYPGTRPHQRRHVEIDYILKTFIMVMKSFVAFSKIPKKL